MDQKVATALDMDLSPYQVFTEREWARLRADTPMTLDAHEVAQLQGLNAPVSIEQVETIYLPLSRLLAFYAEATISIFQATPREGRDGRCSLYHTPTAIGTHARIHSCIATTR